jgi:F-type H+-transporting ATPase subunit epsilon
MQVDIVSAEGEIFSGKAEMLFAQAADGEVGVMPHHTQFLSSLKPGTVRVVSGDEEDHFYVNSGIIEIQSNVVTTSVVTILADTAIRAADLDEAEAEAAKQRAEEAMANAKSDTDIARAQVELAEAVAQIQAITKLRDRLHKTGLA